MAKGIDVRQSTDRVQFRSLLQTNSGELVSTGTTYFYLYELQGDGTLKTYDWTQNVFTTGVPVAQGTTMTHQRVKGNSVDSGIWTKVMVPPSGFTKGEIYFAHTLNSGAFPASQVREFQFGDEQSDGYIQMFREIWKNDMANASGEASRSPLNAVRLLRNKVTTSGGLTVYKEDDSTSAWTGTLTSDAAAEHITSIDPA